MASHAPQTSTALPSLLLGVLAGSGIWTVSSLDSIEACQSQQVDTKCEFNLPTIDDRFSFPDIVPGEKETGICQERGVTLFCRAVPEQFQIDACKGKQEGNACSWQAPGQDTAITIEAFTKNLRWASTRGAVYVSWKINGVWTPPQMFFRGIRKGGSKKKQFVTKGWPQEVAITVNSNDAWGFWKITVNDMVIIEDPAGRDGGERYCSYHPPYSHATCEEFRMTKYWIEGPPATQFFDVLDYETGDAEKGAQTVTVEAHTSVAERADTGGCLNIMFLINGAWTTATEGIQFFCAAKLGEVKKKDFSISGWPSKIWIAINSTDTWGFWKLAINDLVVVEDPAGKDSSHGFDAMSHEFSDSSWWLESPPRTTTLAIPAKPGSLQQGSSFGQQGKCDTSWNGEFFCDDKQYVDRRPANTTTRRKTGTWYVYTMFAVRGIRPSMLERNRDLLESFVVAVKTAIAQEAGAQVAPRDVALTIEKGGESIMMIAVVELTKALQAQGLTVDTMYSNLKHVGKEVKKALDEVNGLPRNFDLAVIDMGEVHESEIKEAMDESGGNPVKYQHNGQDCIRPTQKDASVKGMICSREEADAGMSQKVCAWDPDDGESTLCSWTECEKKCAGTEWCSSFSVSDYTGARGKNDVKEQCWLFEKCFTMDDHDAYVTWAPSCVEPDPEKTGRESMKYEAPKGIKYYDVDADSDDDDDDAPISVAGGTGALIVAIIAGGVCFLICAVVSLLCYVKKLRRQLEANKGNPGNTVAIGRPVVQTGDGPAGAVVGGVPVVEDTNTDADKGQKQVEP